MPRISHSSSSALWWFSYVFSWCQPTRIDLIAHPHDSRSRCRSNEAEPGPAILPRLDQHAVSRLWGPSNHRWPSWFPTRQTLRSDWWFNGGSNLTRHMDATHDWCYHKATTFWHSLFVCEVGQAYRVLQIDHQYPAPKEKAAHQFIWFISLRYAISIYICYDLLLTFYGCIVKCIETICTWQFCSHLLMQANIECRCGDAESASICNIKQSVGKIPTTVKQAL